MTAEIGRIAGRFLDARRAAEGLDDYPGALPATLDDAYKIQDEAIARWARPVIGWKVGRVPPPLTLRLSKRVRLTPSAWMSIASSVTLAGLPSMLTSRLWRQISRKSRSSSPASL